MYLLNCFRYYNYTSNGKKKQLPDFISYCQVIVGNFFHNKIYCKNVTEGCMRGREDLDVAKTQEIITEFKCMMVSLKKTLLQGRIFD